MNFICVSCECVSFNRGKSRSTRGLFVNNFCTTPSAENSHIWPETRIKLTHLAWEIDRLGTQR
jgi:hypothetical protein